MMQIAKAEVQDSLSIACSKLSTFVLGLHTVLILLVSK